MKVCLLGFPISQHSLCGSRAASCNLLKYHLKFYFPNIKSSNRESRVFQLPPGMHLLTSILLYMTSRCCFSNHTGGRCFIIKEHDGEEDVSNMCTKHPKRAKRTGLTQRSPKYNRPGCQTWIRSSLCRIGSRPMNNRLSPAFFSGVAAAVVVSQLTFSHLCAFLLT